MKNLFIALIIGILLVNGVGLVAQSCWGFEMLMENHYLSFMESVLVFTAIAAVLVIVGFIVTISVIGGVIFAFFAAGAALLFAGFGLLWPVILIGIIYLLVRKRPTVQASHRY